MKCKLISLDTATKKTGYCVYENGNYVHSGVIEINAKITGDDAFDKESRKIIEFLNQEKPDIVVVEQTYQKNNLQTFKRLSMILGGVYWWTIINSSFFYAFEAKKWRSIIDSSAAKLTRENAKKWSLDFVYSNFKVECQTDDQADAILIGAAYILTFTDNKAIRLSDDAYFKIDENNYWG